MKTLYIDCGMGAAGDMLSAALLELVSDKDEFIKKINDLGIPDTKVTYKTVEKMGIAGNGIVVKVGGVEEGVDDENQEHHHASEHEYHHEHEHDQQHHHEHHHGYGEDEHEEGHKEHHHHHTSMADIENIINGFDISEKVKKDIINVYNIIAEAESKAHGRMVSEIHFHEVGMMDAICDITMVSMIMDEIKPDIVIASPVHVGFGTVKCAHGIMPVPAPATAYILEGIPMYAGNIEGELCTPTGAALLKYYVNKFENMPVLNVDKIGYGMGKKEFERVNCIRVMLGETNRMTDEIYELSCNIDDMTGEDIGYASEMLFEAGARDVFTIPVYMKKSRSGVLLKVICSEDDKEKIVKTIFKHTTTIGIRENKMNRYILDRDFEVVNTKYGSVKVKVSKGYDSVKIKPEYDDLSRIAKDNNISLKEIRKIVEDAFFRQI